SLHHGPDLSAPKTLGPAMRQYAVHLARELIATLFEQVLAQQFLMERFEHARFHLLAANGQQVVASTLIACAEAGEPVAASHDEPGAADTALRQPGEQVLGTTSPSEGAGRFQLMSCPLLTRFRGCPKLVGH